MDTVTINQTTDIAALVGNLKKSGRYHVGPCPFCGGSDRFNVKDTGDGQLWICRQCGDGKYKDAVAFLMKRDGVTFGELVGESDSRPAPRASRRGRATKRTTQPRPEPRPVELAEHPTEEWQIPALLAVAECCQTLRDQQTATARAAMRYLLENRGLTPETIRAAQLGYNEEWRNVGNNCWLAPGITIPAYISPHLWYVQVRTTKAAREQAERNGRELAKYHALTGSRLVALYGAGNLIGAHTAVVTEGEFDCLLLRQYLPAGFTAVTMGSAGSLPSNPTWLRWFAAVRRVLVVMDNDTAGATALDKWRALLPWVEPLAVPAGHNDITDFWAAGEDMGEFIATITGGNECH